jgi:hypothetical protein
MEAMSQPATMPTEYHKALAIHAVAKSLRLWDRLGLSLGEAVVLTGGHTWSRLVALVATWYGAVPVIMQSSDPRPLPPGVVRFESPDRSNRAQILASMLSGLPAVVAVDLSGRADSVDLLLESIPPMSRLMLAGTAGEHLTIDYYVNVHRKGLVLISDVLDTDFSGPGWGEYSDRAQRLLARSERAEACRVALDD